MFKIGNPHLANYLIPKKYRIFEYTIFQLNIFKINLRFLMLQIKNINILKYKPLQTEIFNVQCHLFVYTFLLYKNK